jgi:UDP-N-acetylglucosamine 4,6-dehydratase
MNVFLTGGAGFLGRAYLRWAKQERPDWHFTVFSRDEGKHARCRRDFPKVRYLIGDVRDYNCVEFAMAGHDVVIHMAAFKYVPQAETNVVECHEINVLGSLNVARAATRNGVKRVIGISTDKACEPINVYGITKLLMEKMFQELNGTTQFNLVRYGNVVSSTGSAIPLFKKQLEHDGFISLTDPDMTRFWLRVEEAVELINLALKEKRGGTVLIPRLPSISMADVARIALDGHYDPQCDEGPPIKIIGQRFGEKQHESLLGKVEAKYAELYGGLMRLYPTTTPGCDSPLESYCSASPDKTLTPKEMAEWIAAAPE